MPFRLPIRERLLHYITCDRAPIAPHITHTISSKHDAALMHFLEDFQYMAPHNWRWYHISGLMHRHKSKFFGMDEIPLLVSIDRGQQFRFFDYFCSPHDVEHATRQNVTARSYIIYSVITGA